MNHLKPGLRSLAANLTFGSLLRMSLFLSIFIAFARAGAEEPKHLAVAEQLIQQLPSATENHYGGGARHIDWDSKPAAARTVCSSFVTLLLMHSYDLSESDYKSWFGRTNPMAGDYHDAIAAQNRFTQVAKAHDLEPGDILAVKYNDGHTSRNGVEDTGHVMVVAGKLERVEGSTDVAPGAQLYKIWVIDSSASGHGTQDTRHIGKGEFTGGIGKGILRLAVDPHTDAIIAYSWSDSRKSEFFASPARDLLVGRLDFSKLKAQN